MAYISSNNNRYYVALEPSYGTVADATAFNQVPAVRLTVRQQRERLERRDKTGSRTFLGYPDGGRRLTTFDLTTYMRDWSDQSREPSYGPLFQACLGAGLALKGALAVSGANGNGLSFGSPHGLNPGQGIAYGNEIRFVAAIADDHSVQLNAPFTIGPAAGTNTGPTATYSPASDLSSATILDCWSPASAVQRMVYGAAIDQLQCQVNGDFHSFQFSGSACDVVDSATFQQGQAGLSAFPAEPAAGGSGYSIIPGHLGQVWIGSIPAQFFTVTSATVTVKNNVNLRDREFGTSYARGISAGARAVTLDLTLYQQDDSQTKALYQAARQNSPTTVMLQLGQRAGQIAGIYLKNVSLETPEFDDSEVRQQWMFKNCRAQGTTDDEITIAFA